MTNGKYLTTPVATKKMPGGIPHILTQETFERFSYYGMRSILVIYMTKYLLGSSGVMSEESAKGWYHLFVAFTYLAPIIGAMISDVFLGKFKTIVIFSIVNFLGLLALVVDQTRIGLSVGLVLITIGSGFIKPCVSANVGDQFGKGNKHLLAKVYSWFYFSVNFGSFFSYMLIPVLLNKYGPGNGYDPHTAPRIAFSVPAASMLLATFVFWMGRKRFVHAPPSGMRFVKEALSGEGLKIAGRLAVIYAFVAMFWSLFSQMDSSWILQAKDMNLKWLGVDWLPAQIMAANPLMIMILIPIFSFGIYPAINKVFRLTPLRKISIGLFVTSLAFAVPAFIETRLSEIRYDDTVIGEVVSNGKYKNDLRINFDSPEANGAAVKALMSSIVFDHSNVDPNTVVRTAQITLVDAYGDKSEKDVKITTIPKDDKGETEIDEGVVEYTAGGAAVGFVPADLGPEDDADFNGGYLLVHRQAKFDTADTLSININADSDDNVLTGIDRDKPSVAWLILACLILTSAEVMVSITVLEFSYMQAPKEMKSAIMSINYLSVFLGNIFTAGVNFFTINEAGVSKLQGANYFWFFTGAMLLTAIVFIPFAARYKEHTYIQEETTESDES